MGPTVHFIVPAFGASPYLSETLDSIVKATDESVPITVLDDATPSTHVWDATKPFYDRVVYERNDTNLGIAANFARAFEISTGDFTVIVGSDDRILPNYLPQLQRSLIQHPQATLVHPKVRVINELGNTVNPLADRVKAFIQKRFANQQSLNGVELIDRLLVGDWMYFPAIAWRTQEVSRHHWNGRLKTACDLDFLLRLAADKAQFAYSPTVSFEYRRHKYSISSALAANGVRLAEELSVHATFLRLHGQDAPWKTRVLCRMAITIRLHGLWMALSASLRNPKLSWSLLRVSLRLIKS
ncbi:unannotated protein [freshwater metagenome]|uniref:Unannotated protein n=1 Tax=freshwater metagenome TaxID=449393 RepID=A0A6J5Z045_9ZZZZ